MKRARLEVSPQFWIESLKGEEMHVKIKNSLPDDVKYIETRYDYDRDMFYIVCESKEFEDVTEDGREMPVIEPVQFETIDCDMGGMVHSPVVGGR